MSLLTCEGTTQFISSDLVMGKSLVPTENLLFVLSLAGPSEHESYFLSLCVKKPSHRPYNSVERPIT